MVLAEIDYRRETGLDAREFIDVLRRSGLDERRPVDEAGRIEKMCANANLVVTARDPGGLLVGVSRSLTDFAFCCYLSDLAVDRAHQRAGIGRELVRRTHEAAGGKGTKLILVAAPAAIDYYARIGMTRIEHAYLLDAPI